MRHSSDNYDEEHEKALLEADLLQSLMSLIADGKVRASRNEDGEVVFESITPISFSNN